MNDQDYWPNWMPKDLPCQFSMQRSRENCQYLNSIFGLKLMQRTQKRSEHPLLKQCDSGGAQGFLKLNEVAEDLRLLDEKPGINRVLEEFSDDRTCLSVWHLIHTAALFERANPGTVQELVDSKESEAPDIVVCVAGANIPVEAKLLTTSLNEENFQRESRAIYDAIYSDNRIELRGFHVTIVSKTEAKITQKTAIQFAAETLKKWNGRPTAIRSPEINLFIEPYSSRGMRDCVAVTVLAPAPSAELPRALSRAKKASGQLRALDWTKKSGILALSLDDERDAAEVFSAIATQTRRGQLKGVAAVMLSRRFVNMGPPVYSPLDLLAIKTNPHAEHPLTGEVPIKPLGLAGSLIEFESTFSGIRAYRFSCATGTVVDPQCAQIWTPAVQRLSPHLLAN
ncbi:MAG: hypothetical protein U1F61_30410 [Opitutaceae bacterium]